MDNSHFVRWDIWALQHNTSTWREKELAAGSRMAWGARNISSEESEFFTTFRRIATWIHNMNKNFLKPFHGASEMSWCWLQHSAIPSNTFVRKKQTLKTTLNYSSGFMHIRILYVIHGGSLHSIKIAFFSLIVLWICIIQKNILLKILSKTTVVAFVFIL